MHKPLDLLVPLALLVGLVLPARVCAQTAAPAQPQGALEVARETAREGALWLASGVDSWFGDKPFAQGGRVSNGQIDLGLVRRPPDGAKFRIRFHARFRLPNVEERGYLFIGRDNAREVVQDRPAAFTRQQRLQPETAADNAFFAGLGLAWRENIDLRLGFRGGLKPYVQARYRQPWQTSPQDQWEFRQTVFWASDDKLGATTALSAEHAFTPTLTARWLSAATYTQESGRIEWSSSLGSYRNYGLHRQLALEAIFTGAQRTGVALTDYGVQLRWEQPVHEDWLLGEFILGRFFPRADANQTRNPAWALGGIVKMRF